jgi:tRNA-(ms[2]io[6]A)-hydroxylase
MLRLRHDTPSTWGSLACKHLIAFLQDHAANERKVSQSALSLVVQHPQDRALCQTLIEIAVEELDHFQQVCRLLWDRGADLGQDVPDPYMGALLRLVRKRDVNEFLLDRLLLFGIVEARGCERFALFAEAVEDPALQAFYEDLTRSEARHHATYHRLARQRFPVEVVDARLDALLDDEARLAASLPLRPALH